MRGDLTVKLDLRPKVINEETDGFSTTTYYSSVPAPVWVVHLARSTRGRWSSSMKFFLDILGWDHVHAEDEDLDAALDDVLMKSAPSWVALDERVWEHEDFKLAAEVAACFKPWATHV